jgi:hypothetical protein
VTRCDGAAARLASASPAAIDRSATRSARIVG